MNFFPMLPSENENFEQEPNPMSRPLYLYLSRSAFLVSFTNLTQQLPNVTYMFKSLGY